MSLSSGSRSPEKEANLNSVASREYLLEQWDIFDQISAVQDSDFSDLEAVKVFCVLASDFYRANGTADYEDCNFEDYCDENLAVVMHEVVSGDFSPHRVIKELKFVDPNFLDEEVYRKRLVLRLATHQPKKTLPDEEVFLQICKEFWETADPELEEALFAQIRENIDFYADVLSSKELASLDTYCQDVKGKPVDLKIDRQHDETLWYLHLAGMDTETLNVFASVVYSLEPFYRGRARQYETATHASEPDAGFNHLLRCVNIDMGMWVEASERQQQSFYTDLPSEDKERSIFLLEEALSVLLHDALEDANPITKSKNSPIMGLNGESMTEVELMNLLLKSGVSKDMVARLITRSQLLDKKKPFFDCGEVEKPATYLEYLERIFNSGDEFAMRTKIVDFFQNSQTDLAGDPTTWKPAVREKCGAWRVIFERQPGLVKVLASIVSPIVVLRWQQFFVSSRVSAVLKGENLGWLGNFQRNVLELQNASSIAIRADLERAA